jgi:NADH-quinone oxidoreductase subunit M
MVNHALISSTLFLIAGMVERRTSTGEFRLLGGMARGRPALATLILTIGVISLAVPLSTSFAGEFLILAGVFQQGWGWAVVGAVSIVLAAMYMLRAISGVLHQDVGPAVPDSALDLRLGELAVVVPLVLCLLGLSAYPALISGRAFGGNHASAQVDTQLAAAVAPQPVGNVTIRLVDGTHACRTASGVVTCAMVSP